MDRRGTGGDPADTGDQSHSTTRFAGGSIGSGAADPFARAGARRVAVVAMLSLGVLGLLWAVSRGQPSSGGEPPILVLVTVVPTPTVRPALLWATPAPKPTSTPTPVRGVLTPERPG